MKRRLALLLAGLLVLGLSLLSLHFALPLYLKALASLGSDLPTPTSWLRGAWQQGLLGLAGLALAGGLLLLAWRRPGLLLPACAALLGLCALALAAALWALALPLSPCC